MTRTAQLRWAVMLGATLLVTTSSALAQDTNSDIENALAIQANITLLMIIVVVVVITLVLVGGAAIFVRVRQLDKLAREQRAKLSEMHNLYRDLQGARRRTESALSMISGKSAELTDTRVKIDATVREAVAQMTQAVALLPVGEKQRLAQDYTGALATYRRAAVLDEDNPLAHYLSGYMSIQIGQLDRAMTHLNQTLDIAPEFTPALAALGYLYRRLAESPEVDDSNRGSLMDESERYLNEALEPSRRLLDEDGEAWVAALAGVYRRRRQYDQAIKLYNEASEITPFSSYPYASLALVYADKNDYAQMYKNYERVEWRARNEVSARPTNPWGHANLMLARLALGRDEKSIEEEFTLTFLSMPRDAAYIVPTIISSLRRLEWALASSGQQNRSEQVSRILQRIGRLEGASSRTTQLTHTPSARATDNVRRAPSRRTGEQRAASREMNAIESDKPD